MFLNFKLRDARFIEKLIIDRYDGYVLRLLGIPQPLCSGVVFHYPGGHCVGFLGDVFEWGFYKVTHEVERAKEF